MVSLSLQHTLTLLRRTEKRSWQEQTTILPSSSDAENIPKGIRVRLSLQSTEANILKARTERALVRIAITEARRTRRGLLPLVERLKEKLQGATDVNDFSYAVRLVDQEKVKMSNKTKTRIMSKFEALLNGKNGRRGADEGLDNRKVVRNLSERLLTESETNDLTFGLNFAVAPKTVPVVDIIAAMECTANELLEETALEFRAEVKKCLQNAKKPRSNLSKEQRQALRWEVWLQ